MPPLRVSELEWVRWREARAGSRPSDGAGSTAGMGTGAGVEKTRGGARVTGHGSSEKSVGPMIFFFWVDAAGVENYFSPLSL